MQSRRESDMVGRRTAPARLGGRVQIGVVLLAMAAVAAMACSGRDVSVGAPGGSDATDERHDRSSEVAQERSVVELELGPGSSVTEGRFDAADPRTHTQVIDVSIEPAGSVVTIEFVTADGATLEVLDVDPGLVPDRCVVDADRARCTIRFPVLEARLPGEWRVVASKENGAAATVVVEVVWDAAEEFSRITRVMLAGRIEHMYDHEMLENLRAAVEELDISVDGRELAAAIALRDRLDAKIARAIGEFDRAEQWDTEGATSMTAWLRDRGGMTRSQAGRLTALARRLNRLPVTAAAWRAGELTGGQVEAIAGAVDPSTVDVFAAHEAELVPSLAALSATDTVTAMQVWKAHAVADGAPPVEPDRALHLSAALDGQWVLDATLDAEGGAVVDTALRLAATSDVGGEPARTPAGRRADALVDVCRHFLDHQQTRPGGRHRPHVNVVIDVAELRAGRGGRLVGGPAVDAVTTARMLCDAGLHRVITRDRSAVLDYGRSTRTIPAPLWNALVIRDEHCRFPGCDRRADWCEAHHVVWFSNGGRTALANLALLCTRHHHRLHQPGWHAKLKPDGALEVTDPHGGVRTTRPPPSLRLAAAA
jgi:hypothetical protein